ncbi:MAG: hypothetical protein PHQ52_05770 [Candidatus Omnitrophica bacterium]|nr:hypothetical protein [Candidatus Omnitrophota bacterium]
MAEVIEEEIVKEIPKDRFKLLILNAKKVFYENTIKSLICQGDITEYELLPYHSPLIGVLKKGYLTIDNKFVLPIRGGVIKFYNNECVIVADQEETDESYDFKAEVIEKDE